MTNLDEHLLDIAMGDTRAFGLWMASAEPVLRDSLRRFAASVDTEAVLQETLLRIWQVAPRFEPDGRPNGLLRLGFRIARNLAVSETRRLRTSPVEPLQLAETVEEAVEPRPPDPLLRRVIQFCRDRLPSKPGRALAARLASGGSQPDAELAARLDMRKNTFLQNITRARKLLSKCLKNQGIDLKEVLA